MDTKTVAAMGILGLVMNFLLFLVVWYVLCLVARWKVFEKAGIAGWKSLIPIYSDYCTHKIAWQTKYFWISVLAGCISGFVSNRIALYTENGDVAPFILSLVSSVVGLAVFVINIMMNINLAKRFGHGVGFGLGLMFLTPLFTLILGLGASEYEGNPLEGLRPQSQF